MGATGRRDRTTARALAVLVAAALAAAGCGLGSGQPQEISRDSLPNQLFVTGEGSEPTSGPKATIYAITTSEEPPHLEPVAVSVEPDGDHDRAVLEALLDFRRPDDRPDLINAIPPNTELLDVKRQGNELTIDLNELGVVGPAQRQAFAQFVYTATELSGITRVRFLENGKPVSVSLEGRTGPLDTPVGRSDFPNLDPANARTTSTTSIASAPAPAATAPPPTVAP